MGSFWEGLLNYGPLGIMCVGMGVAIVAMYRQNQAQWQERVKAQSEMIDRVVTANGTVSAALHEQTEAIQKLVERERER